MMERDRVHIIYYITSSGNLKPPSFILTEIRFHTSECQKNHSSTALTILFSVSSKYSLGCVNKILNYLSFSNLNNALLAKKYLFL